MKTILCIGHQHFLLKHGQGPKVLSALNGAERVTRVWKDDGEKFICTKPLTNPEISVTMINDAQVATRPASEGGAS